MPTKKPEKEVHKVPAPPRSRGKASAARAGREQVVADIHTTIKFLIQANRKFEGTVEKRLLGLEKALDRLIVPPAKPARAIIRHRRTAH